VKRASGIAEESLGADPAGGDAPQCSEWRRGAIEVKTISGEGVGTQ
jgi:hypothetical protein